MSVNAVPLLLQHVRRLAGAAPSDEQLLADFLACRREEAFAALVGRHGPMVYNLCRRILRDAHAAEDVFQATFLVLAERAGGIQHRASLAGFLHGVAYRLAVRAKRRVMPSLPVDDAAVADKAVGPAEGLAWQEMLAVLDRELSQLTDRYRAPLVLCYLQGRTQDEAARQLGWSLNTLRRRLEQARELLEARLRGRGVTLTALLAGLLAGGVVAVPRPIHAATLAAVGAKPSGVAAVVFSVKKGLTMLLSTSGKKIGAVVAVAAVACALGFGYWATRPAPQDPGPRPTAPALTADVAHDDPIFSQVAEAVAACAPDQGSPPFPLLVQWAILEAKRGHKDEAAKLFRSAAGRVKLPLAFHRGALLVTMAYHVAEAGDPDAARALLAQARQQAAVVADEKQASEVLRFAAVVHAENIDPAESLPFAHAIPDENCRLNAFKDIAAEQAKRGDVASALRTVDLIQTPYAYFKQKPWEAIAAAQLKAGDRTAAEATLAQELAAVEQERTLKIGGWQMNQVQVLARYAAAQGQAGDHDGARATFERVEKAIVDFDGPAPVSVFVTLALAQADAGERAAAVRTVQRFYKTVAAYEAGEGAVALIVPALIALGDYDGATTAAAKGRDTETLRQLCEALAEAGRQDKAVALALAAKSPEARAWGLVGAARGMLNRVPSDQRPRYSGAFVVAIVPPASAPSPQPNVMDPVQEYQQIVRQYEESLADTDNRPEKERPTLEGCAERLLKLAQKHPGEPVAVDALTWVVQFAAHTPREETALMLLRTNAEAVKSVGDACVIAVNSTYLDATERLLRTVLEKSPYRTAKGEACLALGNFLRGKARLARLAQSGRKPEDTQWMEETFGKVELGRLRGADPVALEAEAEKCYERVVADFDDIHPPRLVDALGKQARASLYEMRELAVGKPAPEIEGKDLDDKPLRLSDQRGRVVVLTFWATWCGPCRQMIPQEIALVKRLKDRPFVLLGVNADGDRMKLGKFLADNPLPWRSFWDGEYGKGDGQGKIARAWNVTAWPTVYVLDQRGVIRHRDVASKDLDEAVDTLLKEVGQGKE